MNSRLERGQKIESEHNEDAKQNYQIGHLVWAKIKCLQWSPA